MTVEPQTPPDTDNTLELTEEVTPPAGEAQPTDEDGEEEEIPTFGDTIEEERDTDSATMRHMRAKLAEALKENAELKRATPQPQAIEVGEKPTLEGCEWDAEKFEAELDAWKERKAAAERPAQQANDDQQRQYEAERNRYVQGKAKFAADVMDDAEETVKASLSAEQQSVLVLASDDPAKMVLALAKNPAKLAELATETNFFKLAAKVAKLEGQLKMVKRRTPPEPDTPERGSAPVAKQGSDKTLAKLEAEAERTGDRTKVIQYKRQLRQGA